MIEIDVSYNGGEIIVPAWSAGAPARRHESHAIADAAYLRELQSNVDKFLHMNQVCGWVTEDIDNLVAELTESKQRHAAAIGGADEAAG